MSKQKRATCLVEILNDAGVMCLLLSRQHGDKYDMLPGGRVEIDEPPIVAAIRELLEETTLESEGVVKLSEYESQHTIHYVFFIATAENHFEPKDDVERLWLLPLSDCHKINEMVNISQSTKHIVTEYLKWRSGRTTVLGFNGSI